MRSKIVVTMLGVLLSCGGLAQATVNSNSLVVDDIQYYVQTDKSVYNLGEDVQLLFSMTNLRDEERSFGWSPPAGDIIVKQGGNEIWYWSWDKTYPTGPVVVTFGPNETKELNVTWPQIDLHGSVEIGDHTQVSPGTYGISGVFYPTDESVAVDITIIPEPASMALFLTSLLLCSRFNKKS